MFSIRVQDYGFDYSDGENGDDTGTVDVENMYYTAKCPCLASLLWSLAYIGDPSEKRRVP